MASITVTVAAALVLVVLASLWLFSPSYDPREPPPVSHTVPIIGHAFSCVRDRQGFFTWADRKASHKPYSMLIAGRKHYVFSSPSDVVTCFRKVNTLSIAPFVKWFNKAVFGFSKSDIERYHNVSGPLHKLYDIHLLNPEQYNTVVKTYFMDLSMNIDRLKEKTSVAKGGVLQISAFVLMLDVLATASTTAYFGRGPLDIDPTLIHDMSTFIVDGVWSLLTGLPAFLAPKAARARTRMKNAMLPKVATDGTATDRQDVSPFFRDQVKLASGVFSSDGVANQNVAFLFGIISNSVPTTYLLLLHILSVPGLIDDLRTELEESGFSIASISDKLMIVPNRLPILRSCYFETIRMHTVTASFREVLEPTELTTKSVDGSEGRTYKLQKGGLVNMPSSMLHFDETMNPEPEKFVRRRFVSIAFGGLGQNPLVSTRGFGGGVSYCPGRFFADRQIVGFVATLLLNFDVTLANDNWAFPKTAEFDDVAKSKKAMLNIRARC